MDPWARLFRLGTRQYGAVARRQAPTVGIPLATFDRQIGRQLWESVHRGIRLLPGTDGTAVATRVSAAVLAVGPAALATGWTGLFLHGVLDRRPPIITVVVPWNHGTRQLRGVKTIRSRTLLDGDRATHGGLPVATVHRCFVDAARTDSQARLRTLLIDARQRRIADPADVGARALETPGAPGGRRLVAAVRDVVAVGADSVLSDIVHRRLLDAGLPPDPEPVTVPTPSGRILHPDITYHRSRVCIECDSLGFHGTQRGLDLDHRKDQGYRRAGWNCLRLGWYRLDSDWTGFLQDVRLALAAVAASPHIR